MQKGRPCLVGRPWRSGRIAMTLRLIRVCGGAQSLSINFEPEDHEEGESIDLLVDVERAD
jgi:hypothetical protein